DVRDRFPFHLLLDGFDVGEMHEVLVVSDEAGIGADSLTRSRLTADSLTMLIGNGALLGSIANQKEPRRRVWIRRVLIGLARRAARQRIRKLHPVARPSCPVALKAPEAKVAHGSPVSVSSPAAGLDRGPAQRCRSLATCRPAPGYEPRRHRRRAPRSWQSFPPRPACRARFPALQRRPFSPPIPCLASRQIGRSS